MRSIAGDRAVRLGEAVEGWVAVPVDEQAAIEAELGDIAC